MKLVFFLSDITKVGGIERVTAILTEGLIQTNNYSIEIASLFHGRKLPNYNISDNIPITYLVNSHHGKKPHSFKRALKMLSNISAVRKYFKNCDCDFVIAQSFPLALMMWLSGFNPKKIIAVEHVYAWYYGKPLQILRKFIYKQFVQVVVLTNSDKKYFIKQGLIGNVTVIPNPVELINHKKSTSPLKKIIGIGRLVYQKGFDNLIPAFKKIHDKYPEWQLEIFGDGPLHDKLQSIIDDNHLNTAVHLRGISNNISEELSNSYAFILPSRFEGFPMVLIEAMNQGVPCISYNCPNGPADIVKDKLNGLLIKNQDIESMIDSLEWLINHPNERQKMSTFAPESVQEFSKKIVIRKWEDLFESLYHTNREIN